MSSTPEAPEATGDDVAAPAADEVREGLLAAITAELGDAIVGSEVRDRDLWVRVRPDAWRRAARFCRDRLACEYFCFLSGIDWMPAGGGETPAAEPDAPAAAGDAGDAADETGEDEAAVPPATSRPSGEQAPALRTEDGRWKTGIAGGDTRFQVFCRLYSTKRHYGITLKADLDDADPRIDSLVPVYRGADWHERECWEMYGFDFAGHDDLRHIYLPGAFEGHPLRKDFPLLAREVKPWPGLVDVEPMPEPEEGSEEGTAEGEGGESG